MKEIKLSSLTNNKNQGKYKETTKNNDEFNDNLTKNVEIKKETHELRQKSLSDKNFNTEETKNQIQGFYINSAGYGTVPKLIMQDRNLSVTSKAIYAYFCSYTGAGNTCFPSYKKICYDLNIHEETFIKHFKPLVHFGYVQVQQIRDQINGRFSHNAYILQEILPHQVFSGKNSENVENKPFSPHPELPCTVKPGTKINSIKINNNNYLSKKESKKKKQLEQDKISPKKEKNNSNSISQKQTKVKKAKPKPISFDEIIDAYTENEDLRVELREHLKTRKQKKAALTNRALELSLKKLDKLADNDEEKIQIVQNSIINGWVGFFELNEKDKNKLNNHSSYSLDEYVKAMDTFENKSEDDEEFVDEKELEEERRKDLLFEGYEEIAPGVFYDKIFQRTEFLNEESRIAYEKNSGDSP